MRDLSKEELDRLSTEWDMALGILNTEIQEDDERFAPMLNMFFKTVYQMLQRYYE